MDPLISLPFFNLSNRYLHEQDLICNFLSFCFVLWLVVMISISKINHMIGMKNSFNNNKNNCF